MGRGRGEEVVDEVLAGERERESRKGKVEYECVACGEYAGGCVGVISIGCTFLF